jgi:hypothetical protein
MSLSWCLFWLFFVFLHKFRYQERHILYSVYTAPISHRGGTFGSQAKHTLRLSLPSWRNCVACYYLVSVILSTRGPTWLRKTNWAHGFRFHSYFSPSMFRCVIVSVDEDRDSAISALKDGSFMQHSALFTAEDNDTAKTVRIKSLRARSN